MLCALLLTALAVSPQADPPALTLHINHDRFTTGERARVYVEAGRDGYLVVLHADPEGRIRVLFPLDPSDDNFVRGGKRLEVRGRSNRDAFQIDADDGGGTVLAAVAADRFDFAEFTRNDHWDFRALGGPSATVKDDRLAGLLDIVQRMASQTRFEYDVATYVVESRVAYRSGYGYGHPYHFSIGLGFGYPYRFGYFYNPFYSPFCYDPFWGTSCFGYGFGYGFGYRPFWYRPFWNRPFIFDRPFLPRAFGVRVTPTPRFVIPEPKPRDRYTPVQPRPRRTVSGSTGVRTRETSRSFIAPRRGPSASVGPSRSGATTRVFGGSRSGRSAGGSRGSPSRGGAGVRRRG